MLVDSKVSASFLLGAASLMFLAASTNAQCSTHETAAGPDSGTGSLDKHNLACPSGKLLNQFKLYRPKSGQMAYKYTCCVPAESFQCYLKINDVTSAGNVNFLDRQNIACEKGYLLHSTQMENANGGFRYRYYCCAATPENCLPYYTKWEWDGAGNVIYLDRHDIKCPGSQILQQYRMETSGMNIRYKYQCCEANLACPNPYDKFERVLTCDNRNSKIPLTCTYEKKVGASYTGTQSEGQSTSVTKEVSWGLENSFTKRGYSQTTEFDWRTESSQTYMAETTTSASFNCNAGELCQMDQVVGYCSNSKYRVRSSYYKLTTS